MPIFYCKKKIPVPIQMSLNKSEVTIFCAKHGALFKGRWKLKLRLQVLVMGSCDKQCKSNFTDVGGT